MTSIIKLRLLLISILLGSIIVAFSVPLAFDIRALYSNKEMLSPNEITEIASVLQIVVLIVFGSSAVFGLYIYFLERKEKWKKVLENFLVQFYAFMLAFLSVLLVRKLIFDSSTNLLGEFIGAAVVMGVFIFQREYRRAKK